MNYFDKLVDLQVKLYENPRPKKIMELTIIGPRTRPQKHKKTMCVTCPHRLTSQKGVHPEVIAEFRALIAKMADEPHGCHEQEGYFCAGHVAELGV